jgi:glycosyltransferase involved in cell wall biosynthesis
VAEPLAPLDDAILAARSLEHRFLELLDDAGKPVLATSDWSDSSLAWLRDYKRNARIEKISNTEFLTHFEKRFGEHLAYEATHKLRRHLPGLSAHFIATENQISALLFLVTVLTAAAFYVPEAAYMALVLLTSLGFLIGMTFRMLLAFAGGPTETPAISPRLPDDRLPLYTLLLPLYQEAKVLPHLARALLRLDYPHDKLQVLLIVEADDLETGCVADDMARRGPFEVIRVPDGRPRTKPRACNYALNFARGEFTVIYDAEDRPERDQLRKAVNAFRSLPETIVCLQARLTFYNANNWLTRLFTLDYLVWFWSLLPGLDRLNVPMPLGGTSNHFRTDILRKLAGWDAFNVTEDADLGIRIAQLRRRVAMLDSITFEEAPDTLVAWLKQRSRWIKGYMQTWLVHTRDPLALLRSGGLRSFLAFHLFIGGSVFSALSAPILWGISCFRSSPAGGRQGPIPSLWRYCCRALGSSRVIQSSLDWPLSAPFAAAGRASRRTAS